MRGGALECVLAREHAPAEAEGGHAHDPGLRRAGGRLLELARDPLALERCEHGGGVHLAGSGSDQHAVALAQVATACEGLPERGLRKGDPAPNRLRVGGRAHGERAVEGELRGPAQRLQRELLRELGDARAVALLTVERRRCRSCVIC